MREESTRITGRGRTHMGESQEKQHRAEKKEYAKTDIIRYQDCVFGKRYWRAILIYIMMRA